MVRGLRRSTLCASCTHAGRVQNLGTRSGSGPVTLLLQLYALKVLLVFQLLLDVLVSLKQLIVLVISDLQLFRHNSLLLLPSGVHLVKLLLDQLGFGGYDLLVSSLHVPLVFILLKFLASNLNFMRFRIPLRK